MAKRSSLAEEDRRMRLAMDVAFDDFLIEKVKHLDVVPEGVRAQLLHDWRSLVEYGFCKGCQYEMDRCQEERK